MFGSGYWKDSRLLTEPTERLAIQFRTWLGTMGGWVGRSPRSLHLRVSLTKCHYPLPIFSCHWYHPRTPDRPPPLNCSVNGSFHIKSSPSFEAQLNNHNNNYPRQLPKPLNVDILTWSSQAPCQVERDPAGAEGINSRIDSQTES